MHNDDTKKKVLISIKPKYVNEILEKKKLFEFRRSVFKHNDVGKVIIYASSPVKRIVGEFDVRNILRDTPKNIWNKCKNYAGIDEDSFMDYFADKNTAFSIVIDNLKMYDNPINPYDKIDGFRPPQSYMFFNAKLESAVYGSLSS